MAREGFNIKGVKMTNEECEEYYGELTLERINSETRKLTRTLLIEFMEISKGGKCPEHGVLQRLKSDFDIALFLENEVESVHFPLEGDYTMIDSVEEPCPYCKEKTGFKRSKWYGTDERPSWLGYKAFSCGRCQNTLIIDTNRNRRNQND